MNRRDHPIWEICRILAIGLVCVGALYVCATEFDETEWRAIAMIMGGGGAASMGITWMKKRAEKDE